MKKKGKKFSIFLSLIIVIGICGTIGLIGWFGYDNYQKFHIEKLADDIVDTFDQNVEEKLTEEKLQKENEEEKAAGGENTKTRRRSKRTDYTTRYNDCIVIGTIRIPDINIRYPIMNKQTEEAMKIGVVVVFGPGITGEIGESGEPQLNEVGNSVILGHNYRNGTLFAKIGKLKKGASIFIKDESGREIEYKVYKVSAASPVDSSFYNQDTDGKREITLSTCNKDGSARTIVQAREK